jgi:hypothetical protein
MVPSQALEKREEGPADRTQILSVGADTQIANTRGGSHDVPGQTLKESDNDLKVPQIDLDTRREDFKMTQCAPEESRDKYSHPTASPLSDHLPRRDEEVITGANFTVAAPHWVGCSDVFNYAFWHLTTPEGFILSREDNRGSLIKINRERIFEHKAVSIQDQVVFLVREILLSAGRTSQEAGDPGSWTGFPAAVQKGNLEKGEA